MGQLSPKGRGRLAHILEKEDRQTRIGRMARPVKNFSPSRLEIKKGKFPSPTVSDGRPMASATGLLGRPYRFWAMLSRGIWRGAGCAAGRQGCPNAALLRSPTMRFTDMLSRTVFDDGVPGFRKIRNFSPTSPCRASPFPGHSQLSWAMGLSWKLWSFPVPLSQRTGRSHTFGFNSESSKATASASRTRSAEAQFFASRSS